MIEKGRIDGRLDGIEILVASKKGEDLFFVFFAREGASAIGEDAPGTKHGGAEIKKHGLLEGAAMDFRGAPFLPRLIIFSCHGASRTRGIKQDLVEKTLKRRRGEGKIGGIHDDVAPSHALDGA